MGPFLWLLVASCMGLLPETSEAAVAGQTIAVDLPCVQVLCPPDQTLYTCNDSITPRTYPIEIVQKCAGAVVPVTGTCEPPPGTPLGVGAHVVNCVFRVNQEIVGRCSFKITVVMDTEPPKITCPPDLTAVGCADATGLCGAVVNYPAPTATDNSDSVSVTCVPPSGSVFPCGTTLVTCSATDRCQNISRCTFKVVVVAGKAPTIVCPSSTQLAPLVVACNSNCVPVKYPLPNVLNGTLESCTPRLGECLPPGNHLITCTATNECGRTSCEFIVRIVKEQGEPPIIRCPQDIAVTTCDPCIPVLYPDVGVVNGTLVLCEPKSGTCFKPGTNVVTCLATNSCSKDVCRFQVIVRKGNPPVIRCPQDILVTTCQPCIDVSYPAPVVVDGALISCNPPAGSCFKPGVNIVTCVASNQCGRTECKFTVVVRDVSGEPIKIACPDNLKIETCDPCAKVTYPAPVVVNGSLASCSPPSGSCLPPGLHVIRCVATNRCGQVAECKFLVSVRRTGPPVIKCPDNLVLETCKDCAELNFPLPGISQGTLAGCDPKPGTCLKIGTHVVTCLATNDCGATRCQFTVTVRKQKPIDIKCPQDIVIQSCGEGEVVHYPRPTILGSDDTYAYDLTCEPAPASFFPVGTNKVVCCVFDRCSQRRICCSFNIIVRPGQACVKVCASTARSHSSVRRFSTASASTG